MTDVTKIILTPAEQRAFDKFVGESDTADLTKQEFQLLKNKGLLKNLMDGNSGWFYDMPDHGQCELNDTGKSLRAYQARQHGAEKKASRRYWITTGIAIAALIKSFWPEISSALAWLLTLSGQ